MQDDVSSATMESRSDIVNKKEIPYRKSVFIIILNEFCERFSYLGLRAIVSIYLVEQLLYSENEATVIFHSFHFVAFSFPLIGSIIADSWLGKFKTIFYFSLVYVCGSILLTVASVTPLNVPNVITIVGLFVIAIGTGCIKTSVMPFGAEQFVLPQQQRQLAAFYSMYYLLTTFGGVLSAAVTPLLRRHLVCFGEDNCYPAAFGLPAVFMSMSIVMFYFAKRSYIIIPHEDNLIVRICKCMGYAIKMKVKLKGAHKSHWLDYSEEEYGKKLVEDIKRILSVFFMFLPVPLYWALIEQTATAWVFMARRMNGDLGFYTLSPDQMNLIGSIMYISLIPVLQFVIVPRLELCGVLRKPLQKMIIGGLFVVASFLMAAVVSFGIENTNNLVVNAMEGQLRVYNTLPCDVSIFCNSTVVRLEKGGHHKTAILTIHGNQSLPFELKSSCANISGNFMLFEKHVSSYFFKESEAMSLFHEGEKEELGLPLIRTMLNPNGYQDTFTINYNGSTNTVINGSDTSLHSFNPGLYTIEISGLKYQQTFSLGGVYTVIAILFNQTNSVVSVVEVTPPHSVHMLWIIPTGFILDIGIILFTIPGLEFAYSQAPACMKTVIMAGWLLTTAVGNLIIVVIQAIDPFEKSSYNFLFYSALMLSDVAIFSAMAIRYKYVNHEEETITTLVNPE